MSENIPPHIGEILLEDVVHEHGLTVTETAQILGVCRPTLSRLLNGRADLSAEMALRFQKAFGQDMDRLLRLQLERTIAKATRLADQIKVERFV